MFPYETFNKELAEQYLLQTIFAFDIETDTNDYHWTSAERGLSYVSDMTHISFYAEGLPAIVLTASLNEVQYEYEHFNIDTEQFEQSIGTRLNFSFSDEEIEFVRAMFERGYCTAIAHNLVFDARQIFGKFGITVPQTFTFWDTQAMHRFGAWPSDSFSLFNLTAQWLTPEQREWWASFKGERGNLTRLLTDQRRRERLSINDDEINAYVAVDSIMAYTLFSWQYDQIYNHGFPALPNMSSMVDLAQIDLDYIRLCVEMSVHGLRANTEYLKQELIKYTRLWKENLTRLGLTVETEALFRNKEWQQNYIFSRIEQPTDPATIVDYKLKTKSGAWSFAKDPIAFYIESYDELILYRYHSDLETKIEQINNFLKHSEFDGRIHFILSRHAITGRNISSLPNMQNLKLKYKRPYNKDLKAKFGIVEPGLDVGYTIADEGYVLVSLDCSNAETWMEAMYAKDDDKAVALCQSDFHTEMAKIYFANEWDNPDMDRGALRSLSKNITFGTAFGMGVKRLSREIRVPLEKAQEFINNRNRKFWRVEEAKKRSSNFAEANGYTVLWTGRKVAIEQYNGRYKGYTAWNSLTQGGVGEMIVRGMLDVKAMNVGRVVSQVHDEIIMQIDPAEYVYMQSIIEALSSVIPDAWNERTTPNCRWLFTFDNIENAHKWGFNPLSEYPLPLTEYVNRWGTHQYLPRDKGEAPTWINQHGYGEAALNKELGFEDESPQIVINESFDWGEFEQIFRDAYRLINSDVRFMDRTFVFPQSLYLQREAYHKGLDNSYLQYIETFDKLVEAIKRYEQWKNQ